MADMDEIEKLAKYVLYEGSFNINAPISGQIDELYGEILKALRKAKADGIRMAATLRDSSDYDSLFLFREAVKIEHGLASIIENVATSTD